MFSFFADREKDILGIDIGTATMKVVELERREQATALVNYGEAKTREYKSTVRDVIARHSLVSLEEVVGGMLGTLLEKIGVKTKHAVLSIPVTASFLTTISFPAQLKDDELENAVPYEAASYVPLPLAEVELDWIQLPIIGESKDTPPATKDVLVVAVPKEIINKYQRIAALAGIELRAFEVETFSLVRSSLGAFPDAVLLDVGASSASVTIVDGGAIRASHAIEIAGAEFTRVIAEGLRINPERAEEAKAGEGMNSVGAGAVRNILLPFVDRLVEDVRRVVSGYEAKTNRTLGRIVFSGGTSRMNGLADYIQEKFGREVIPVNPFALVQYPPDVEPLRPELNALFGVAVGLALRELL